MKKIFFWMFMVHFLSLFAMQRANESYQLKIYRKLACLSGNCTCDGECQHKPKMMPAEELKKNSQKMSPTLHLPRK